MRDFLIAIKVIQVVSNEERRKNGLKRLGKGYFNAYRINPYNPISYPVVIIAFLIGVLLFGFVGIWSQTDGNPFRWN